MPESVALRIEIAGGAGGQIEQPLGLVEGAGLPPQVRQSEQVGGVPFDLEGALVAGQGPVVVTLVEGDVGAKPGDFAAAGG